MLLCDGTCQNGRLPSSSRGTIQTSQYGVETLLSSRQILFGILKRNYENSGRCPTPEQVVYLYSN